MPTSYPARFPEQAQQYATNGYSHPHFHQMATSREIETYSTDQLIYTGNLLNRKVKGF